MDTKEPVKVGKYTEGEHFTVGKWVASHNSVAYDNYCCTKCQFSTIYPERMVGHWDKAGKHKHAWAFPVDPAVVDKLNEQGKPPVY